MGSGVGKVVGSAGDDLNLQVMHADLSEPFILPGLVDAVCHAAARAPGPGVSVDDMVRDNVVATRNLIGYARNAGAKVFVFFSSLSVYGEVQDPILEESTPVCSPGAYGLTKRLGEEMLGAESSGMRSLAMRLPGLIGRGSARNWLSRSLAAAQAGKDVAVFNPNALFNNAVHIADLCRFVGGLLDRHWHGFDLITLGAAGHLTAGEVAARLAEGAARGSRVVIEDSHRSSFRISNARAQERFGYSPMDMSEMLDKFIAENQ